MAGHIGGTERRNKVGLAAGGVLLAGAIAITAGESNRANTSAAELEDLRRAGTATAEFIPPTSEPEIVIVTATPIPSETPAPTNQATTNPSPAPTETATPSLTPAPTETVTPSPTATTIVEQLSAHADFAEDNSDEDWSFQTVDSNHLVTSPLTAHARDLRALDALQKYVAQGATEKAIELLAEDDLLQRYLSPMTHYGDDFDPARPETSGLGFNAETISAFDEAQLIFDALWTPESLEDSADLDEPNPRETFLIPREDLVTQALEGNEGRFGLGLAVTQTLDNNTFTLNYNQHFYGVHNMQWSLRAQAIDALTFINNGNDGLSVQKVQEAAQLYAERLFRRAGFSVDPNEPMANQGGFATIAYQESEANRTETVTVPNFQGTWEYYDSDTETNDPLDQEAVRRCVLVSMQTDSTPYDINWNVFQMGANGVWSNPTSINVKIFLDNLSEMNVTLESASAAQMAEALYNAGGTLSTNRTDMYFNPPAREALENEDPTVGRQTFFTFEKCEAVVNRPAPGQQPSPTGTLPRITTTPGQEITVTPPGMTGTPWDQITPTPPEYTLTPPREQTVTPLPTNNPVTAPTRPAATEGPGEWNPTAVATARNTPDTWQEEPAEPLPNPDTQDDNNGNEQEEVKPTPQPAL